MHLLEKADLRNTQLRHMAADTVDMLPIDLVQIFHLVALVRAEQGAVHAYAGRTGLAKGGKILVVLRADIRGLLIRR